MVIWRSDNSVWYIVPTQNLRLLIIRNAKKLLPGCNYIMQWKDVRGFGIELAVSSVKM